MKTDMLWKYAFPLFLFFSTLLLVITYGSTLDNPFFFDDKSVILNNPYIKSLIHWREFFADHNPYFLAHRGVNILSLALNYQVGGSDPFSYHLTSILLHLGVSLLLFLLCRSLLLLQHPDAEKETIFLTSAFVSLLFLLHPVHTASVSYIAKRDGILVGFFVLSSLLAYHTFRVSGSWHKYLWLFVSVLSFAVAFWSKETAIICPLLILLYELFFHPKTKQELLRFIGIVAFIGIIFSVYLLFFFHGVGLLNYSPGGAFGSNNSTWPVSLNIATQSVVLVHYLTLLLFPLSSRLSIDQDFPVYLSFFTPETVLSFCFHGAILYCSFLFFKRGWRLAPFGILWFYLALMPESSFIPLKEVMVDYRTYVPSLGLGLVVAEVCIRFNLTEKKTPLVFLFLILSSFTVITKERNLVFDSRVSLWKDAAEKAPFKLRPHYNLAYAYFIEKQSDKAIAGFRKTLHIAPDNIPSLVGLAQLFLQRKALDEALQYAANASGLIEKKEKITTEEQELYAAALYVQGVIFAERRELKKAHGFALQAVKTLPNSSGYLLLTKIYLSSHQLREAEYALQRARMFDKGENRTEIHALQNDITRIKNGASL